MTLTPEQFQERLVDYLYGELSGDDLASFEASLASSEARRRELASMQKTLGLTRRALAGPLASEPPARVRSAVLQAAEAAARASAEEGKEHEVARQAALARAEASALSAREPGSERPVGWRRLWAWLTEPWVFPALGVASAFVIWAVLERRDLNAPMPASAPEPMAQADREEAEPAAASEGSYAQPPPAPKAAPGRAPGAPAELADKRASRPQRSASRASSDDFAEPAPAVRARGGGGPSDEAIGKGMASAGSAPVRRRDVESKAPAKKSELADEAPLPPAASAPAAPVMAEREAARKEAPQPEDTREVLVRRAQALVDAGERTRAAEVYRTLLRDHPDDARADTWRRTLTALIEAQAADDAEVAKPKAKSKR